MHKACDATRSLAERAVDAAKAERSGPTGTKRPAPVVELEEQSSKRRRGEEPPAGFGDIAVASLQAFGNLSGQCTALRDWCYRIEEATEDRLAALEKRLEESEARNRDLERQVKRLERELGEWKEEEAVEESAEAEGSGEQ